MLVHIFRGPGRVFGLTGDATGANLPSRLAPWTTFKSIELSREGEPTAGVDTNECLEDIEEHGSVATITSAVSTIPKGLSPVNWLDDFLYLPEVLYVIFFIWLLCSGPGKFSVDYWLAGKLLR